MVNLIDIVEDINVREAKHRKYTFGGITILQHPNIKEPFIKIIKDFDRIIELGTYFGAFTLFLHTFKRPNCELISYDIATQLNQVPKEYGIDFRWGNWWDEKWLEEFKQLMGDTSKRVLLLCDGGYKEYEFNTFCPYLKLNDVIMVHDYQESKEEYESYTHPIEWYDVADAGYIMLEENIKKYNLVPHKLYNQFKSVLWGIFIKA